MVVIVEVIDDLAWLDIAEVDITSLGGPLEVEEFGVDILILKPPLFSEGAAQLVIATLDDVHLLVEPTPIALLPGSHVDILLLVILLLFLLCTIHIDIIPVLYLGLLGKIDSGVWLRFILQTAQLLISQVVELDPSAILPLAVQQLGKGLLHFAGFHGHGRVHLPGLQLREIVLPAIQHLVQRDQLVPEVHLQCLMLGQFGLDAYFVLGHEDLLGTGTN